MTCPHYGTITVNHWLGYGHYFGLSSWGGYPGCDILDVQSGIGMANNVFMLEGAEKSVYRAPFHKLIDPYTVQSKRIAEFGCKCTAFDGTGSLAKFVSLLWNSMRC